MDINWYPGHMAKTRRMIEEMLGLSDVVCELRDARIPEASRNPDIAELISGKPRVIVLNRADQADPDETKRWAERLRREGAEVFTADCKSGKGVEKFAPTIRRAARERINRLESKGRTPQIRVMIVGIPNVGKSSLINRLAGEKRARTEDRPGVTRGKQWFTIERGLEILDTPGVLWPKIEDRQTGLLLAYTGAIRDQIMDTEQLAAELLALLRDIYPGKAEARFKLGDCSGLTGMEMLTAAARKRGCILPGGELDIERISAIVLDEFRGGKIGRFTLEKA